MNNFFPIATAVVCLVAIVGQVVNRDETERLYFWVSISWLVILGTLAATMYLTGIKGLWIFVHADI